jgi:hypothetical protein
LIFLRYNTIYHSVHYGITIAFIKRGKDEKKEEKMKKMEEKMKKIILFLLIFEFNSIASIDEEEARFLEILNNYRIRRGRQPVKLCASIERASEYYANFMADMYTCYGHTCDGKTSAIRCREAGYGTWCSECAHRGADPWGAPAEFAFNGWRNSPDHNSIMLDPRMQAVGIARAVTKRNPKLWFWVLNMGMIWDKSCKGINPQCKNDSDCVNNSKNKVCKDGICVECKKDNDCQSDEICKGYRCIAGCRKDEDCSSGMICVANKCIKGNKGICQRCTHDKECGGSNDRCLPYSSNVSYCGIQCQSHSDCGNNYCCHQTLNQCYSPRSCNGKVECCDSSMCGDKQICARGLCKDVECVDDSDCSEGDKCIQNQCITPPKPGECSKDEDCASKGKGWRCVNSKCIPPSVDPNIECFTNEDCGDQKYCNLDSKCVDCILDEHCDVGHKCDEDGKCISSDQKNGKVPSKEDPADSPPTTSGTSKIITGGCNLSRSENYSPSLETISIITFLILLLLGYRKKRD